MEMSPLSRIKSILLVDFESLRTVAGEALTGGLSQWLLWLEDGAFSEGQRRRRFVEKRIYWGPGAQPFRPRFEAAGFCVVCARGNDHPRLAPARMSLSATLAMDAMEIALTRRDVCEFVILSADCELVALVNRLQPLQIRVVACGRQEDRTYQIMRRFADEVIHLPALQRAATYQRSPRKWYQLRSPPPEPIPADPERASSLVGRVRAALAASQETEGSLSADLVRAADILDDLGRNLPDQPLAKVSVLRALGAVERFTPVRRRGLKPWLGERGYTGLLRRLAGLRANLELRAAGGGEVVLVWRADIMPVPVSAGPEEQAVTGTSPDKWAADIAVRPVRLSLTDEAAGTPDPSRSEGLVETDGTEAAR